MGCNGHLWTPRGLLTTSTAVWSIVISLVVGGLAGLLLQQRWAMLVVPAVFAVVFEITGWAWTVPMVDGLHASFYGAIAFITGPRFQALLTLVPMASVRPWAQVELGGDGQVAGGRWCSGARRRGGGDGGAVGALTAALLRPASTAPILAANSELAGIGGRADHRQHGWPRSGTDDPRDQHRQPRPALPGRRARVVRSWVRCAATLPRWRVLHRRDVGPAGAGTSYDELVHGDRQSGGLRL